MKPLEGPLQSTRSGDVRMSKERARHMGLWVMERFTVCSRCSRYTHTTRERICRKCFESARKIFATLAAHLGRVA